MNKELYATLTSGEGRFGGKICRSNKSRHGKCSDWIRENRRRRSCGLPQKRVLPGLGIFDPIEWTIEQTLPDGTVEIRRAGTYL